MWYKMALVKFKNTFLIRYGLVKNLFLLHYNFRLIQMAELLSLLAISLYLQCSLICLNKRFVCCRIMFVVQ